ncbi:hypothetical protein [Streptomyces nojiriensis]|uniref:hypothetical protein n=1 Tax=Streptomyces nojiriensis TaxID=66374 RepID=UPI0036BC26EF
MKFKNSVHAALLTTARRAGTAAPAFADSDPAVSTADQAVAAVPNATGTSGVAPDSTTGTVLATDHGLVKANPGPGVLSPAAALTGSGHYSGSGGDGYCRQTDRQPSDPEKGLLPAAAAGARHSGF